jgi:hypothetical protein
MLVHINFGLSIVLNDNTAYFPASRPLSSGYDTTAPGMLMVTLHAELVPLRETFKLELFNEASDTDKLADLPLSNDTHFPCANEIDAHRKTKIETQKIDLMNFL